MQHGTYRKVAVLIVGTGTFSLLSYASRSAWAGLFEVDNPTTFARLYHLWVFLAWVVPGLGIGLFAIRNALVLAVAAYLLGYAIYFLHRFAIGSLHVGDFTVEQGLLLLLRELACAMAVGAAAALAGAYIRRRLTIGSSDRGSRLRWARRSR